MKMIMAAAALLLSGCASQLDIQDGDCSITLVEVDGDSSTWTIGKLEANGWVMVTRGECPPAMIDLYRQTIQP